MSTTQRLNPEAQYWRVLDAVRAIGRPCLPKEVDAWLEQHHPEASGTRAKHRLTLLSVNDPNRRHHNHGRRDFRSDQGHPQDVIFRTGSDHHTRYELYDIARHGVWDLVQKPSGHWVAIQVVASPLRQAMEEARDWLDGEQEPLDGEDDARRRVMRALALREGQQGFRMQLLEAYGWRCAVTGCDIVELLEAAHICPYRGEHTHRTDNGLLLRTDIHTLFDKGLLWIDRSGLVQMDERLVTSEYASLRGKPLRKPSHSEHAPHRDHLAYHRKHTAGQLA